jgi:hypothetical protein
MAQQQDKAGNNIVELEEGDCEPPQPPEEDADPPVILAPARRVRHGYKSVGGLEPRLQLQQGFVETTAADDENKEAEEEELEADMEITAANNENKEAEEEELEADNENKKRKRKN